MPFVIFVSTRFNRRVLKSGETAEEFIVAVHSLADNCNFVIHSNTSIIICLDIRFVFGHAASIGRGANHGNSRSMEFHSKNVEHKKHKLRPDIFLSAQYSVICGRQLQYVDQLTEKVRAKCELSELDNFV